MALLTVLSPSASAPLSLGLPRNSSALSRMLSVTAFFLSLQQTNNYEQLLGSAREPSLFVWPRLPGVHFLGSGPTVLLQLEEGGPDPDRLDVAVEVVHQFGPGHAIVRDILEGLQDVV